jgi:hypothetical protein
VSRRASPTLGPRLVEHPERRDVRQAVALRDDEEFLRTPEAARFMRFGDDARGIKAFFAWAYRWDVPRLHRGRTVLWERRVLLAFLHRRKWTAKQSVA